MKAAVVSAMVLGLSALSADAATIHVPTDRPTIQAGIEAAIGGDTVIVANGIYTGPGNREIDFYGKAITVRSAAGNPDSCIIDCADAQGSYTGVYFHSNEDTTSVLAGFTIQHGVARHGDGFFGWNGGGLHCGYPSGPLLQNLVLRENTGGDLGGGLGMENASAIVRDCRIIENYGGGVFVSGAAVLERCQISQNSGIGIFLAWAEAQILGCTVSDDEIHAYGGGGVTVVRGCSIAASMDIRNGPSMDFFDSTFTGEVHYFHEVLSLGFHNCTLRGSPSGALRVDEFYTFTIEDCLFISNTAAYGGAIQVSAQGSHGRIERTRFEGNHAGGSGGALFAEAGVELVDCEFLGNTAGGGIGGGAIAFEEHGEVLRMTRCTIAGNGTLGGAPGGAISAIIGGYDSVRIEDCLLSGNRSEGNGGGLFLACEDPYYPGQLLIIGSTISANRSLGSGGGISSLQPLALEIGNTILWGNCAEAAGDQLLLGAQEAAAGFACCAVDSAGVAGGTVTYASGTLFVDPRFCSPLPCDEAPFMELEGFTLEAGSRCLPENNDCGLLIGALGHGCTLTALPGPAAPAPLRLSQNHPNPFNARTSIVFSLLEAGPVELRIYDLGGRERAALLTGTWLESGTHRQDWNGQDAHGNTLPSGAYLCRLEARGRTDTRKLILLK